MILASASPRRRELLGALGFELTVIPADVDETRLAGERPTDLVRRLAKLKAQHVYEAHGVGEDGFLVAADTIVWLGDDALGKPASERDACVMLRELSGRTHHVSTGVCIRYQEPGANLRESAFVDTTDVTFHELSESQIKAYVSSGECMDKAGSYAIQGKGRLLVARIEGDYGNVVGLPTCRVVREMDRLSCGGDGSLLVRLLGAGPTAAPPVG